MNTFDPKWNPELNTVKVQGSCLRPFSEYSRRPQTSVIVIHCAATPADSTWTAEEVRENHIHEREFRDIGYHYVIERDGSVSQGRPMMAMGAGVNGHNSHTLHVCLMGGADKQGRGENNFTPEQWASLELLVFELKTHFFPLATVQGHRDFPRVAKDCPSFDAIAWYRNNVHQKVLQYNGSFRRKS